jgi:hypothetical protein
VKQGPYIYITLLTQINSVCIYILRALSAYMSLPIPVDIYIPSLLYMYPPRGVIVSDAPKCPPIPVIARKRVTQAA